MAITIAAIHTASPMIEATKALVAEYLSEDVNLINITDDSLIQEVIRENGVTEAVKKRLNNYYQSAVDAGADIIFNTCSSVGEVASNARSLVSIPIVKIDDAMTEKAVSISDSIGVLATLATTLGPTVKLLKEKGDLLNKKVTVAEGLALGAFEALMDGDSAKHDQLIIDTAKNISDKCDIIVLAQGSMARMQEQLKQITGKEVLASPILGVLSLKPEIEKLT